jgi:hypothetical protein
MDGAGVQAGLKDICDAQGQNLSGRLFHVAILETTVPTSDWAWIFCAAALRKVQKPVGGDALLLRRLAPAGS